MTSMEPPSTNGAATRFELPSLQFKFSPLTDGTNIPPPLPSPIEEEAPTLLAAPPSQTPDAVTTTTTNTTTDEDDHHNLHHRQIPEFPPSKAGTKRPADLPISPVSPTHNGRPNSIRRLFSRRTLHSSYADGDRHPYNEPDSPRRPESQASFATTFDNRSRRTSSWFNRLRGGGGDDAVPARRMALSSEESVVMVSSSPPPPMIPELSALKARVGLEDGTSFGDDLFTNIK